MLRYPYLTSNEEYRRFTVYKQKDQAHPRWLLVQEYDELREPEGDWYLLKKSQANHWWKRQGFTGVKIGFFDLVKVYGEDGEEDVKEGTTATENFL